MRLKIGKDLNERFILNDFWKLGVWGDPMPKIIPASFEANPEVNNEIKNWKLKYYDIGKC